MDPDPQSREEGSRDEGGRDERGRDEGGPGAGTVRAQGCEAGQLGGGAYSAGSEMKDEASQKPRSIEIHEGRPLQRYTNTSSF